MQSEPEWDRKIRRQQDARTALDELTRDARHQWSQLPIDEFTEFAPLPTRLHQQVIATCKRLQPPLERDSELLGRRRRAHRLVGDRLNDGE